MSMDGASAPRGAAGGGDLRVFLVAGEPSGDALAGPLMAALTQRCGPLRFAGIGGPQMAAQGLQSMFPMSELSLMGLVEVLPHLPQLWRRLRQTEDAIRRWRPDVVVTVDAPGFNFRLAKRLVGSGVPVVHYVAPTVWAWRPGRARHIAPLFRHLLAVLPFEPPWFEPWGLPTTYVGHPVLQEIAGAARRQPIRRAGGWGVCLLPGSRASEIRRLLPVFGAALEILRRHYPDLSVRIPTVPAVGQQVRDTVQGWVTPPEIIVDRAAGLAAMAAADVALAASGTVTLELALLGTPFVAAYRANPLTAAVIRRLIRVPHVTLVNLILDRLAVPELLQQRCRPDLLAAELERLLADPAAADQQRAAFGELAGRLTVAGSPSACAAAIVADIAVENRAGMRASR